ncbi:histidinol phosphate aminotransferase [Flavobacterium rivuli WB 3.3-2 = DSM 21788]|uniref:Histidinol-phosphate aminotransferase n=1 Tax=Flavobacterium rivuli WB 3.3-2 = DSM 21788 TaxID=1121895 RepID=A0A0A2MAQ9_9FLAO|nr:histidinol-phosphate transaminase [Flavobacterium rivuli]KGO88701.1 histidinol phosphate aminotransferase [Flavobacterium rivuli WB 3.3-2 = DSM 21788]
MFDITKIVRPNILNLEPYSSARDEFEGSEGIFMDANENPFGDLNRYPDPLQKAVKQKLSDVKGIPVENIFLGNGSDEIIDLCFRVFCEPAKDKALTFVPTYGMYEVSATINNVELEKIPLNEKFQINTEDITLNLLDPLVKVIFICSPNNPTGNCIKAVEFIIKNFGGIVVVDEAYIDFADAESLSKKLDIYPNLIVLQTLSKAWGLAAARVGIAFAGTAVIKYLNKVKPPYNISTLNQSAALYALQETSKFELQRNIILQEKSKLLAELESLDFVIKIYPSDTNFFLIVVKDADAIYNKLISSKIIIRNRNKIVKNCLRITIGTPAENEALLAELKNITL